MERLSRQALLPTAEASQLLPTPDSPATYCGGSVAKSPKSRASVSHQKLPRSQQILRQRWIIFGEFSSEFYSHSRQRDSAKSLIQWRTRHDSNV
jgi:hypothetical protein